MTSNTLGSPRFYSSFGPTQFPLPELWIAICARYKGWSVQELIWIDDIGFLSQSAGLSGRSLTQFSGLRPWSSPTAVET